MHGSALGDLDLAGIAIADEDLSDFVMSGCRLTAADFTRVTLSRASIQLSFLDRATFRDCDFTDVTIMNAVFAGSHFERCSFAGSEIIQVNFLGIRGVEVTFDHSDLYGSRFLGSWLDAVRMRDCNLTRAYFDAAHRDTIDFRSSNTNEATFIEEEP